LLSLGRVERARNVSKPSAYACKTQKGHVHTHAKPKPTYEHAKAD
jgi:hypothetical protein